MFSLAKRSRLLSHKTHLTPKSCLYFSEKNVTFYNTFHRNMTVELSSRNWSVLVKPQVEALNSDFVWLLLCDKEEVVIKFCSSYGRAACAT